MQVLGVSYAGKAAMAYWLAMQGTYYDLERRGGYLWARFRADDGRDRFYWKNLEAVRRGDLIFSYVNKQIVAIGAATGLFSSAPRPLERNDNKIGEGRRVPVAFADIHNRIGITDLPSDLSSIAKETYGFLGGDGRPNQGYLYGLDPRVGRYFLKMLDADVTGANFAKVADVVERSAHESTERTAISKSRIGQGRFRDSLLALWKSKCCVSGLDLPDLLVASHIKPWSDSNDDERLDENNGLLLNPMLDALFDGGYCTFDDQGNLLKSNVLTVKQCKTLSLDQVNRIEHLNVDQRQYLAYHRSHVFNRTHR